MQVPPNANPNAFYTELVTAPYANNAIISTHVYGPSVTHATTNYSGSGLNWRLSVSFGKKTLLVRLPLSSFAVRGVNIGGKGFRLPIGCLNPVHRACRTALCCRSHLTNACLSVQIECCP